MILQPTIDLSSLPIDTRGLIGYWDSLAGGANKGIPWRDLTGNGLDATITDIAVTDDVAVRPGDGFSITNGFDHAQIADSPWLDINNALTIAMSVYQDGGVARGLFQRDSGASLGVYECHLNNGQLRFILNANTGSAYLQSSSTLPSNTWSFISCTYDKSLGSANMKAYINGVQDATTVNYSTAIADASQGADIGQYAKSNNAENCKIDFVTLWNRAINLAEHQSLFEQIHVPLHGRP